MSTDAHYNEYLAAIAALPDQTISHRLATPTPKLVDGKVIDTYAVGDRIMWREADGTVLRGIVVEVLTDTTYHVRRHVPDHGNQHYAVEEGQILPW